MDTGFNREDILRLQTDASYVGYKGDEPRLMALYQQIEEKVSALPGVHAASFSSLTFHEGSWNTNISSEREAATMFPKGNVIGLRFGIGGPEHASDITVIGVVKEVKFGNLQEDPATTQHKQYLDDFEVRCPSDFAAISAEVQTAIHSIDRNLPITRITSLDEQVGRSITNQRLVAQLSTFFGLPAVFLSCIGLLAGYLPARKASRVDPMVALRYE